jgi:hypothetical protein
LSFLLHEIIRRMVSVEVRRHRTDGEDARSPDAASGSFPEPRLLPSRSMIQ